MLVIGQHGNGQRIGQIENGVGSVPVASQVIQNNGQRGPIGWRRGASNLVACWTRSVDLYGVRSCVALQIVEGDSLAALSGFLREPMTGRNRSQSLLNLRDVRPCL